MIHLTKINHQPLVLNLELIEFIENKPDTTITLVTGNKVVVLETAEEVIDRVVDYRRRLLTGMCFALPPQVACEPNQRPSNSH